MTSSLCHRLIGLLTLLLWLGTCVPALAHHTAQHEIPCSVRSTLYSAYTSSSRLIWCCGTRPARPVPLQDYFGRKPIILSLVYYDCPNLCTMVLNGLLRPCGPSPDCR